MIFANVLTPVSTKIPNANLEHVGLMVEGLAVPLWRLQQGAPTAS